jgi:diguanylate cyclase (GGDEF)-like protein
MTGSDTPQTILVIDDSPDIHPLLDARLGGAGVALRHALTAEDGLAMAREAPPDLILLDVMLPSQSGFEVCRALREEAVLAAVPVIFLSGAGEIADKVHGFDLGAVDYVTKPFEPSELNARVRAALRSKHAQDLLAAQSEVDALTGLRNRGGFERRLREEVAAVARYGRTVSLVMVDLDHFKSVNDTYGHAAGDAVLRRVGELLRDGLRPTDIGCRFGGEEIALILTETPLDGAIRVAERMRVAIESARVEVSGHTLLVTASFGVASSELASSVDVITPAWMVQLADEALYRAKRTGRNQVCSGRIAGGPAPELARPPERDPLRVPVQADASRIVVVDDDDDTRTLHSRFLRLAGFAVTERADAVDLVDTVRKLRPAAVLLDISLPGVNGIDACSELKRDPDTRATRVVILTSHQSFEAARRANEAGADLYLVKPITREKLLASVPHVATDRDAAAAPSWGQRLRRLVRR